jgi:hypothetical protein
MSQINADFFRLAAWKAKGQPTSPHLLTVLWACSPQRHIIPQTKTQAHAYADRAAGYQPAASHHPANASLCAANA